MEKVKFNSFEELIDFIGNKNNELNTQNVKSCEQKKALFNVLESNSLEMNNIVQKIQDKVGESKNNNQLTDEICLSYLRDKYSQEKLIAIISEKRVPILVTYLYHQNKQFVYFSDKGIKRGVYLIGEDLVYAKDMKINNLTNTQRKDFVDAKTFNGEYYIHETILNNLQNLSMSLLNNLQADLYGNSSKLVKTINLLKAYIDNNEEEIIRCQFKY